MIIAISSAQNDLNGPVEARFGRAPGFIVYNTETQEHRYIENTQNLQAAQGAGIQSAQHLLDNQVEAVLTGHCGPKAFRVLQAAGVAIYIGVQGTVREGIDQCISGSLKAADSADVEGHWV